MEIKQEDIKRTGNSPVSAQLLNIRHVRPHYHQHGFEIVYCLEGSLSLISAYRYRTLKAGDFFMIDLEEIHTLFSDEDNRTLMVHIGIDESEAEWEEAEWRFYNCDSRAAAKNSDLEIPLTKVSDMSLALAYTAFASMDNDTLRIFGELRKLILREFTWVQVNSISREENEKYKDRLHGILKYIQLHYREKITLSQLSKLFYISENYLSRFLRNTNMLHLSLLVWFCRCYEAEKLLAHTDLKIPEISERCGFSSEQYFYKYFRHFYKITPLQHRKRLQKQCSLPDDYHVCPEEEAADFVSRIIVRKHCERI
ncbi:MAG: helix-turn-helix domain-containing protein [Clostridia bacterium]|nr:helix-turn-helix domain-containing protein [Clostridia bacterium]